MSVILEPLSVLSVIRLLSPLIVGQTKLIRLGASADLSLKGKEFSKSGNMQFGL